MTPTDYLQLAGVGLLTLVILSIVFHLGARHERGKRWNRELPKRNSVVTRV